MDVPPGRRRHAADQICGGNLAGKPPRAIGGVFNNVIEKIDDMNEISVVTDIMLDPSLPATPADKVVNVKAGVKVVRIPAGMASGRPSIAILALLPERKMLFLQMSLKNFLVAAEILKEADQRAKN